MSGKGSKRRPATVGDHELDDRWNRTFRYRTYKIQHPPGKAYWRVYDHQRREVHSEHFGLSSELAARRTADTLNGEGHEIRD